MYNVRPNELKENLAEERESELKLIAKKAIEASREIADELETV